MTKEGDRQGGHESTRYHEAPTHQLILLAHTDSARYAGTRRA